MTDPQTPDNDRATETPPVPAAAAGNAPGRAMRGARWASRAAWGICGILLLLIGLVGGIWVWTGTGQSLAYALAQAARYMPEGMTLESNDVTGSLRKGGHIGRLRWQSPTLAVEVQDATLGWSLPALLHRKLKLGEIHIARVDIEPLGPKPEDDKPIEPLTQLALPIDIELPFKVDALRWAGPPELVALALSGEYRYGSGEHRLKVDGVDIADGHYSAELNLQGAAPMALDLRLLGRVSAPLDAQRRIEVSAKASAKGNLSGPDARLQVEAEVAPTEQAEGEPMRANLQAEVAPWQPQPIVKADATLHQLDLARLWPQAPATLLTGEVHLGPDAAAGPQAWRGSVDLRNANAGPWDEGRLPLDQLQGEASYDGHQWKLPRAVFRRGAGSVEATGNWRPAPEPWQAQVIVRKLSLGDLHTRLAGAPLDGKVQANQQDGGRIDFSADLQAQGGVGAKAAKGDPLGGLRLRSLVAKGQWQDEQLILQSLRAEAAGGVQLDGQGKARPASQSGQGQVALRLPGLEAKLKADMAPTKGQGELQAQLADMAALQRWVESLPGLDEAFGGQSMQGTARLDAKWTGGWQTLQQRLSEPQKPAPAGSPEPTLRATLEAPKLGTRGSAPPEASAWQVSGLRAEVDGSLANAQFALSGDVAAGARHASLALKGSGGLQGVNQWRVALASLDAQLRPDVRLRALPWLVRLEQPVAGTVRVQGDALQYEGQGSAARITGPLPGTVQISWGATRFSRSGPPDRRAVRLQSTGRLAGLPLGWARAFGSGTLEEMGISGDVVFEGSWDIDAGDQLRGKLQVRRTSGDIQVQAGEAAMVRQIRSTGTGLPSQITTDASASGKDSPGTPAGLKQAQLTVEAQGADLNADLVWDSERAGVVRAQASTRLARGSDGWLWPADAPIDGKVEARMPKLGVWSILAPPGWRVGGTLNAQMTLSGRRDEPRWNGTLSADDLALRAAVEGIDLRNGKLRATLEGQRLVLQEFSLQGGPGSTVRIPGRSGNLSTKSEQAVADGGSLMLSGSAAWGQGAGQDNTGGSGIRMDIRGEVKRLRVLVRADRQVTLSGDLQAGLERGKLTLRSKLTTDRGVIILPASTAPNLGSDVKIHSAARAKAEQEEAARKAKEAVKQEEKAAIQQARTAQPPDILITLDLGRDFAVQGHGITTRLEGQLDIRANSTSGPPRVTGEVRTVNGAYRAYGQQLDVETGIARFNGQVDNPQLDIIAIRPNIDQRAGVRISGTALAPRVNLYSEPPLSDAETLSWIMLGRASASNGGEAVLMQQAALALLGTLGADPSQGSIAQRFGLDEIGFKGPGDEGDLQESSVTLGKRLSQDFYVTYERSLAGTMGTLYLFYDLTQRLTLRGQAGEEYGADLIYTIKYD
ncbi:translocation/assembly module TamB domain-containing protein [Variovorax dokdonensis]|uniref:Translocation/assembly module TamB domain-containing protein n=1 Tax=Variovorax dokdonensis TaxID=344883 RepID=A0ABT7N5D3_9BURK|nr:translocation/assembly module TamB domain-containing protein [Variovorax dokdonensis]MDM0043132.1 translocation/assembly module TamB domain-containing protein [Variovorax dokdonensis]